MFLVNNSFLESKYRGFLMINLKANEYYKKMLNIYLLILAFDFFNPNFNPLYLFH